MAGKDGQQAAIADQAISHSAAVATRYRVAKMCPVGAFQPNVEARAVELRYLLTNGKRCPVRRGDTVKDTVAEPELCTCQSCCHQQRRNYKPSSP